MFCIGLAGDLKKAMKDGKPIIIEVNLALGNGSLNFQFKWFRRFYFGECFS